MGWADTAAVLGREVKEREIINHSVMSTEKAMEPHSSTLAWRIPGKAEPAGLPSMGSHRVRHDYSDLAAAAAVMSNSLQPHGHYIAHQAPPSM